MTAPAYVSTRQGTGTFVSTQNGVTINETPKQISSQPTLNAVLQDAAKHGVPLDLSSGATGVPKLGH